MNVKVERISVWEPGEGESAPPLKFLPPLARRRLSVLGRAAMEAAWGACPRDDSGSPLEIAVVFASRWGEIGVTERLMRQFHDEGEMSPAAFSLSVHNAAVGAFSVFTRNHAPYTAIAAGDDTFVAGLTEAWAMKRRVLFVYAEEATPAAYRDGFGEPVGTFAVAMLLDAADVSARAPGPAETPIPGSRPRP